jgi:8-oxo-dGTP pyrophosphatase MutT (NUDIX family)
MNKSSLLALINQYLIQYPEDVLALETLAFVNTEQNFWQSDTTLGHITASAWVLDQANEKVLLTHHLKLGKWFQLGGHVEATDQTIAQAAMREAMEESGFKNLELVSASIFDIDVHWIPENKKGFPRHRHFDIRMLLLANSQEQIQVDEQESADVQWVALNQITDFSTEPSILRMRQKTTLLQRDPIKL